jgi:hypothetical protein
MSLSTQYLAKRPRPMANGISVKYEPKIGGSPKIESEAETGVFPYIRKITLSAPDNKAHSANVGNR